MAHFTRLRYWLVVALLASLAGCSLPRMIDSEVQSFVGSTPAQTGASYRFERLPSQANNSAQDQIEALAQGALDRIGLQRIDDGPGYLVQVSVSADTMRNPHYRPPRPRLVVGANGVVYEEWPLVVNIEAPWFRHRVQVLLRDSASGQLAYETAAVFEGPWSDTLNLLPPMLEAALKDYPLPGKRTVVVELPAAGRAAR
jgi:hypothetical protein